MSDQVPTSIKAVIVGGGKACRDLLLFLEEYQPRHTKLKILGVADINPEAPGLKLASKKGIFTTSRYEELFAKFPRIDLIIELTGKEEVLEDLWCKRPPKASILDHRTTWVFWEIITLLREKAFCEVRLREMENMRCAIELTSHLAHEVRNPLVVIGGLARRLLALENLSPPKAKDYARVIAEQTQRLEKIMKNLSKVVEPLKPQFAPEDVNRLVREICEEFRLKFPHLQINLSLEEDIPKIYLDRRLLKQALWELLKNAVEASSPEKVAEINVETRLCYDSLAIIIEDQGIGMDEETVKNATLPFYSQKDGHLGLGLYLVSKIAKAHGGKLYFYSKKGEGTTAVLELPLRIVEHIPLI